MVAHPLDKAFKTLSDLNQTIKAQIFGRSVHVETEETDANNLFKSALVEADCSLESIEHIRPSLEDAFISLVQEQISNEIESLGVIK